MNETWSDPQALRALLIRLVGWPSVSGTSGERTFPGLVAGLLREEVPALGLLELVDVPGSAPFLAALHRHEEAADTIVLLSHYDTVSTEEYRDLEPLAFDPAALASALATAPGALDAEAAADLASGEYVFGRGVMDMKMGLALHMALVQKASAEQWPINLLLLTVPDEEVGSAGMRAAVPWLVDTAAAVGLRYTLILNSEPSFPLHPGDARHQVCSGSIGKVMPTALVHGKETHAGEPLSGITSTWIISFLTRAMELNAAFREIVHGESTPLPVTLGQQDVRAGGYSVKTPSRSWALYNVFTMRQDAGDVMRTFERVAQEAAAECARQYLARSAADGVTEEPQVTVLRYENLVAHARAMLGDVRVDAELALPAHPNSDDREAAIQTADRLLSGCPGLAPAIVLMFTAPCYPPVDSAGNELVEGCIERAATTARERFGIDLNRVHFMTGITDLSYANADGPEAWSSCARNMPGFGSAYDIPFEHMARLDAPVLNLGPFGKDAHKRSERVHAASAFDHLPHLLEELVRGLEASRPPAGDAS